MKAVWTPDTRPRAITALADILPDLERFDMASNLPMCRRDAVDVETYHRLAFLNMTQGAGNEESWEACVYSLNMALMLCEAGYGPEYEQLINDALEGAFRAKVRAERTGRWGFDGPAMTMIRESFDVHSAQLEHARRSEIIAADRAMKQRIAQGHVFSLESSKKS